MRSYSHSEFEHERRALEQLGRLLPDSLGVEFFPVVYLADEQRGLYQECDLLMLAPTFAAVVELKDWRGRVTVGDNVWYRDADPIRDPHELNMRKAKTLKNLIGKLLPTWSRLPFVESIVVLTAETSDVQGAERATDAAATRRDRHTFDGVREFATYVRQRLKEPLLSPRFPPRSLVEAFDERFSRNVGRTDYADQVPGFRIRRELENTDRYVSYLADQVPGGSLCRIRVFGQVRQNSNEPPPQSRSLDSLEKLQGHPNIARSFRHPNERGLIVEVSPWFPGVETLDEVLIKSGPFHWRLAARMVRDLASALSHIHSSSAGLIHRNVWPRSVLVGRDHHVELTDFDLTYDPAAVATVLGMDADKFRTNYMAPEVASGRPDYRSDVYSLGRLLEEMLGLNRASTNNKTPEVPDELGQLLGEMTAPLHTERPEAATVAERLTSLIGGTSSVPKALSRIEEPEIDQTCNTWVLRERLGGGATADVFRGENLGDRAALKIFHPTVPRERCLAERDFLRAVNSPYVQTFRGFMQWRDTRWCLITELIEGTSLQALIKRGERPQPDQFRSVAERVLMALTVLHDAGTEQSLAEAGDEEEQEDEAKGIIHNDVTPGNILLCRNNGVRLIDFGRASRPGLTDIGGTPGYVRPDLLTSDGYRAEPSGDLFSFAVTMIEWATGIRPTAAADVPDLFPDGPALVASRLGEIFRRAIGSSDEGCWSAAEFLMEFQNAFEPALKAVPDTVSTRTAPAAEQVIGSPAETSAFVDYLNTLHNVSADNRHALAEAQAVSRHFGSVRVDMPITERIAELFRKTNDSIIILSGHAGDGKSTIALDLLKACKGLMPSEPMQQPPDEVEYALLDSHPIAVVKDMSELSAAKRREIVGKAAIEPGGWLIVSNTGPLLRTLSEHFAATGLATDIVEHELLKRLDKPLPGDRFDERHCYSVPGQKPIHVVNLSKLENAQTAATFLGKVAGHTAWSGCEACGSRAACPIRINTSLLRERADTVGSRVRLVYRRLAAYGRRMTMRQMTAHLAYSVTCGLSCADVLAGRSFNPNANLFSEAFFGHASEHLADRAADALFCLRQMRDHHFGAASTPALDCLTADRMVCSEVDLPPALRPTAESWQALAAEASNGAHRRKLRRMLYMFGKPSLSEDGPAADLESVFLQSPMLPQFDEWTRLGKKMIGVARDRFVTRILRVLMEEYTGCPASNRRPDFLHITLRRPDDEVFQPIQIILRSIPTVDFELNYDGDQQLPYLAHVPSRARLYLPLPLLDNIAARSRGDLVSDLDAIHRAAMERFRSELFEGTRSRPGVTRLMQIDAEGALRIHEFSPSENDSSLEYARR